MATRRSEAARLAPDRGGRTPAAGPHGIEHVQRIGPGCCRRASRYHVAKPVDARHTGECREPPWPREWCSQEEPGAYARLARRLVKPPAVEDTALHHPWVALAGRPDARPDPPSSRRSVYLHRGSRTARYGCILGHGYVLSDSALAHDGPEPARVGCRASQAITPFTDRVGDPYSPQLLGFWHVQFWNVLLRMREARNPETIRTLRCRTSPRTGGWIGRSSPGGWLASLGIALLMLGVRGLASALTAGLLHAILALLRARAAHQRRLGHWRGAQNFGNTAYNSRAPGPG